VTVSLNIPPAEPNKEKRSFADVVKAREKMEEEESTKTSAAEEVRAVKPAQSSGPASDKKGKALDEEVKTRAVLPQDKVPASWRQIQLDTNYFNIVLKSAVYEYAVTFTPDLGDSSKRKLLIRRHGIPSEITLMGNCFYSNAIIPDDKTVWTIPAREAGMPEDVTVTLALVNTFTKGMELPGRIFAALFQRALATAGYTHIQRNFFDFRRIQNAAGGKYIVIPGVEVAVVPAMCGLSLMADVTNKVARTATVLDMWVECRGRIFPFTKDLEGSVVYTNYNNRSYIVKRVVTKMRPSSTFETEDGKTISFAAYLKARYNRTVSTDDQPLLECERRGGTVYLVPEFCQRTGFDDRDRRDFRLMSEITKMLFPEPQERQRMIANEVKTIEANARKVVDVSVSAATKVPASIIPISSMPKMTARDNLSRANARVMAGGKPLNRLCIVCDRGFDSRRVSDTISNYLQNIGVNFTVINVDSRSRNLAGDIQKGNPDFVLFVTPNTNDKDAYRNMKLLCTHQLKVPSQVVSERNLSNPKKALPITCNVARQMAVKIGKCPWVMPFSPITKGTMVVGLDACHTTSIGKSVVGMVASLDDTFGKYLSDFFVQDRGKEIAKDLGVFVRRALEKYKKKRGFYPKNVIILRDGVGDGQLMYVNDVEMISVYDQIQSVNPDTRLTFVVVKKRIRTRLFSGGRNPVPGTIVDTVVTNPNWYDFFLVSHETRNGTVSPTHYNVLLDDVHWPKSELQSFIYLLCYQYYNWDGSISVPAPCQYAHKMAFLYGRSILSSKEDIPRVPTELEETLLQI